MDHYVVIGYFVTAIACVAGITWLAGAKSKITAPILLTAIFIAISIMTLSTWKQPLPEGVLPVLASVVGYAFGVITKKDP